MVSLQCVSVYDTLSVTSIKKDELHTSQEYGFIPEGVCICGFKSNFRLKEELHTSSSVCDLRWKMDPLWQS